MHTVAERKKTKRVIEDEREVHRRSCDHCNAAGEKSDYFEFLDEGWVRLSMKARKGNCFDWQEVDLCAQCFAEWATKWLMPGRLTDVPEKANPGGET